MSEPTLPVQILGPGGRLPERAHPADAGLDLVAAEELTLAPGAHGAVGCQIAVAIPPGWAGLVMPRSGLARRHGVTVLNAPGLIDAGYRGELQVLLINHADAPHTLRPGDRVAQLVLTPIGMHVPARVAALPTSDGRGDGGFGSSGR